MMISLSDVKSAYEKVKNHPYRVDKIGNPKYYGDAIIKLSDTMYDYLKKVYYNGNPPGDLSFHWSHDFNSIGYHFRSYGIAIELGRETKENFAKQLSHDIRVVDRYLNQVHAFIDTEVFEEFDGYYAGCNPCPGWYHCVHDKKKHKFIQTKWTPDEEVTKYGEIKDG